MEFPTVKTWILTNNIEQSDLDTMIPRTIEITMRPGLMEQFIGKDAASGYVVYNIARHSAESITMSWTIVMTMTGDIVAIEPSPIMDSQRLWVNGLKPLSAQEILLSYNWENERGPLAIWNWKKETVNFIANSSHGVLGSAHDAQWTWTDSGGAIWRTANDITEIRLYDAKSGDELPSNPVVTGHAQSWTGMQDVNHLQAFSEYGTMLLNCRMSNNIVMVNTSTGNVLWTLGGDNGNAPITDMDGIVHPAGSTYWIGAHNAEYFGNNEIYLFDNGFNTSSMQFSSAGSRLLGLSLTSEDGTVEEGGTIEGARVIFEMHTHSESSIFGDLDQLPSKNLLSCDWPNEPGSYDARAFEVVRDTHEIAWEMRVFGEPNRSCASIKMNAASDDKPDLFAASLDDGAYAQATTGADGCTSRSVDGAAPLGWYMYSVERLYAHPLIYAIQCDMSNADSGVASLNFTAHNNFKQNDESAGRFEVTSDGGSVVRKGTFMFERYWLPASVNVEMHDIGVGANLTLNVYNLWGSVASHALMCSAPER